MPSGCSDLIGGLALWKSAGMSQHLDENSVSKNRTGRPSQGVAPRPAASSTTRDSISPCILFSVLLVDTSPVAWGTHTRDYPSIHLRRNCQSAIELAGHPATSRSNHGHLPPTARQSCSILEESNRVCGICNAKRETSFTTAISALRLHIRAPSPNICHRQPRRPGTSAR